MLEHLDAGDPSGLIPISDGAANINRGQDNDAQANLRTNAGLVAAGTQKPVPPPYPGWEEPDEDLNVRSIPNKDSAIRQSQFGFGDPDSDQITFNDAEIQAKPGGASAPSLASRIGAAGLPGAPPDTSLLFRNATPVDDFVIDPASETITVPRPDDWGPPAGSWLQDASGYLSGITPDFDVKASPDEEDAATLSGFKNSFLDLIDGALSASAAVSLGPLSAFSQSVGGPALRPPSLKENLGDEEPPVHPTTTRDFDLRGHYDFAHLGPQIFAALSPVGGEFLGGAGASGIDSITGGFKNGEFESLAAANEEVAAEGLSGIGTAGRRAGRVLTPDELAYFKSLLNEHGVELHVGSQELPPGLAGGFRTGGTGRPAVLLLSDPTAYEMIHETMHMRQWLEYGPGGYANISEPMKELYVFRQLETQYWDLLTPAEQVHAEQYMWQHLGWPGGPK